MIMKSDKALYGRSLEKRLKVKNDERAIGSPRLAVVGLAAFVWAALLMAPVESRAQSLSESLAAAYGNCVSWSQLSNCWQDIRTRL